MKAIVWTRYGPPDGLVLAEVAKPVPRADEVLIRVYATTVTAGDCELRSLRFSIGLRILLRLYMGVRNPRRKILGQELAGKVEAVGNDVKRFKPGDEVFGTTGFGFGAYAEYICLPTESRDSVLAIKPVNMSYEEAAAVPMGGLEALRFLRKVNVHNGQRMLINGAGGSIGTLAVQLGKHLGVGVTGVDRTGKLEMLRSIGADRVIDYTREDFSERGDTYEVILDVVGKSSFSRCLRSLKKNGCYLLVNPRLFSMLRALGSSIRRGPRVIFRAPRPTTEDLVMLKELVEAGKLRSAIDRRYALEGVPDAHRYVEAGDTHGKVVITVVTDVEAGAFHPVLTAASPPSG